MAAVLYNAEKHRTQEKQHEIDAICKLKLVIDALVDLFSISVYQRTF